MIGIVVWYCFRTFFHLLHFLKVVKVYAEKENFEVIITVLFFGCILINKVLCISKKNIQENFFNFVVWRVMNDNFCIPPNISSAYVPNRNGGTSILSSKESKNHWNGFSKSLTYTFLTPFLLIVLLVASLLISTQVISLLLQYSNWNLVASHLTLFCFALMSLMRPLNMKIKLVEAR